MTAGSSKKCTAFTGSAGSSGPSVPALATGSPRQILRINQAGTAAEWSADCVPLTQRLVDSSPAAVSVCATITHQASLAGNAGIGARFLMRASNGDLGGASIASAACIDGILSDTTAGGEVGALDVCVSTAGSLARVFRVSPSGLRFDWTPAGITVQSSDGLATLDVWRISSTEWVFGSKNTTYSGGTVLQCAGNAGLRLVRGDYAHFSVDGSSGQTLVGSTLYATGLQGTAVTVAGSTALQIGFSSVVAVYVGGARVPERTVSTSTTLDAQDEVVFVDTTTGPVTLTLPAGASGRLLAVQRIAGSNAVTVQRAGTDVIRTGGTNVTSTSYSDDSRHSLIWRSGGSLQWVAEN